MAVGGSRRLRIGQIGIAILNLGRRCHRPGRHGIPGRRRLAGGRGNLDGLDLGAIRPEPERFGLRLVFMPARNSLGLGPFAGRLIGRRGKNRLDNRFRLRCRHGLGLHRIVGLDGVGRGQLHRIIGRRDRSGGLDRRIAESNEIGLRRAARHGIAEKGVEIVMRGAIVDRRGGNGFRRLRTIRLGLSRNRLHRDGINSHHLRRDEDGLGRRHRLFRHVFDRRLRHHGLLFRHRRSRFGFVMLRPGRGRLGGPGIGGGSTLIRDGRGDGLHRLDDRFGRRLGVNDVRFRRGRTLFRRFRLGVGHSFGFGLRDFGSRDRLFNGLRRSDRRAHIFDHRGRRSRGLSLGFHGFRLGHRRRTVLDRCCGLDRWCGLDGDGRGGGFLVGEWRQRFGMLAFHQFDGLLELGHLPADHLVGRARIHILQLTPHGTTRFVVDLRAHFRDILREAVHGPADHCDEISHKNFLELISTRTAPYIQNDVRR